MSEVEINFFFCWPFTAPVVKELLYVRRAIGGSFYLERDRTTKTHQPVICGPKELRPTMVAHEVRPEGQPVYFWYLYAALDRDGVNPAMAQYIPEGFPCDIVSGDLRVGGQPTRARASERARALIRQRTERQSRILDNGNLRKPTVWEKIRAWPWRPF